MGIHIELFMEECMVTNQFRQLQQVFDPQEEEDIHPSEPRTINIREAARIQSFPDWYFKDIDSLGLTKTHLDKIIGDAVPSMMVFPLILSLYESIESLSEKSI